jgi:hypothetical protein
MGSFALEKWKFGVYLLAPVLAVFVYSLPSVHETHLKYSKYITYTPSIDDTHLPKRTLKGDKKPLQ